MTASTQAAYGLERIKRGARRKIIELHHDGLGKYAIASRMARSRHKLLPGSHSVHDRSTVYTTLLANEGNVKRTARDTGVNESTVRRWKREFETNPPKKPESGPQNAKMPYRPGTREWVSIVGQVLRAAGLCDPPHTTQASASAWDRVISEAIADAKARLLRRLEAELSEYMTSAAFASEVAAMTTTKSA